MEAIKVSFKHRKQLANGKRLFQEYQIIKFGGPLPVVKIRTGSQDENYKLTVGYVLFYLPAEFLAGHSRHIYVRNQDRRLFLADFLQGYLPVQSRIHRIALFLQGNLEQPEDMGLIVDNEYTSQ